MKMKINKTGLFYKILFMLLFTLVGGWCAMAQDFSDTCGELDFQQDYHYTVNPEAPSASFGFAEEVNIFRTGEGDWDPDGDTEGGGDEENPPIGSAHGFMLLLLVIYGSILFFKRKAMRKEILDN